MANHFSTPWQVFRKGEKIPKGSVAAHPGASFIVYFLKIKGDYDPVINLIRRAPSMLALLEKALPIIEEEAERRSMAMQGDSDRIYTAGEYWTEMRDLANEIQAEIDRAHGRDSRDVPQEGETCPHGFGFVEYCEECNQKEIKAKWREKEDFHG